MPDSCNKCDTCNKCDSCNKCDANDTCFRKIGFTISCQHVMNMSGLLPNQPLKTVKINYVFEVQTLGYNT